SGWRKAVERADVAPTDAGADGDLAALGDDVAAGDPEAGERLVQQPDRLFHCARAAAAAGGELVAEEVWVYKLVGELEIRSVRDLFDQPQHELLVRRSHGVSVGPDGWGRDGAAPTPLPDSYQPTCAASSFRDEMPSLR